MPEELEPLMQAQLATMRDQIEKLKDLVIDTEEHTARLKYMIANDLMEALIKRFQTNETKIVEMEKRILNIHEDIKDQLIDIKRAKDRHESDLALESAIKSLLNEGEVKVDSEPLYRLK